MDENERADNVIKMFGDAMHGVGSNERTHEKRKYCGEMPRELAERLVRLEARAERAEAERDRLAEALRGILETRPYAFEIALGDDSLEGVRLGFVELENARAALASLEEKDNGRD